MEISHDEGRLLDQGPSPSRANDGSLIERFRGAQSARIDQALAPLLA